MENQELRKHLEQLRIELEKTQTTDAKEQELLQAIAIDINELLERSGGGFTRPHSSLIQRLEYSIERFEVTHPTLTITISKLLASLSNAGI